MNKSLSLSSQRRSLLLLLGFGLVLLFAPRADAQSTSQDPKASPSPAAAPSSTATPSASDTAAQTEAQKRAAERKKRFEEQKNLLDGGGSAAAGATKHAPVTDTEFWIDPIGVNMMATESQEVHVFDWRYNDVSARVSWSLSNSEIVDMTVKGVATITAKMPGTVSLIGTIDGHTVEAVVTVYRGEKLPWGTPRTVSNRPPINHGYVRGRRTPILTPH